MTGPGAPGRRPAPFGAGPVMLVLAILVIGLNQRPAITAIPPVQDVIAADLGMSPAAVGALTSVPLVCFALVSLVVPALVRRFGVDRVMLGGLVLLAVAVAVRPWGGVVLLFAATVLVGAGITIANVLQPVVVRRDVPHDKVGFVMPLSTAALSTGAALASLVAVDSERWLGWRPTLALVAVPVVLAAVMWLVRMRATRSDADAREGRPPSTVPVPTQPQPGLRSSWREGSAWWLAVFFAIQSSLFYAAAAWLPSIISNRAGVGRTEGGYALTLYFLLGIVGSLVMPVLVRRLGSFRRASPVPGTLWTGAFLGLILAPGLWPVWCLVAGVGQGIGIGLGLTLIAVRPVDEVHGRSVSAMVQSVAYALAALGPVAFGWLFDVTAGWLLSCLLGVTLAVVQNVAGWFASSDRPLGVPRD